MLRPEGKYRIPRGRKLRSHHEWSSCNLKWRVVELWTIPAEELLEAHDVGMIPWLPLTEFSAPPEDVIQKCRDEIEQRAPPEEKANLLAVTQVLTRLRYNEPGLFSILGGPEAMIESPLIQELVSASGQKKILAFLETRFGPLPPDIPERICLILDDDRLTELARSAASCPDLNSFREAMR